MFLDEIKGKPYKPPYYRHNQLSMYLYSRYNQLRTTLFLLRRKFFLTYNHGHYLIEKYAT